MYGPEGSFWATWIDSDIIQKWDHGQQFCSAANSSLVMPLSNPCVNYVRMLLNYPNLNTTFNTLAQTYFQNPSNLMQDWKGALHFFLNLKNWSCAVHNLRSLWQKDWVTLSLFHLPWFSTIQHTKKKWKIKQIYQNLSLVWDWNSPTPQATLTFLAGPSPDTKTDLKPCIIWLFIARVVGK